MKNKRMYITRLVYSILTTGFLIYFFSKTTNGRIIFIPFLICGFSQVIKNILMVLNKKEYAKIFDKLFVFGFLLFWFGFLIYWCFASVRDKNYTFLLPTIPFWIVSIYIIKKKLFRTNKEVEGKDSKKEIKFNFKVIVSVLLVATALLSGILMLFFGIRDTYRLNKETKNYIATNGYYKDYEIYKTDEDGTTYKLTYAYTVDNQEYYIETDYATNYIPEKNSIREVKYNPNNPEKSILVGTNNKNTLIYMGAFFTLGSLTFVIAALTMMGVFDKFKIDVLGTYMGVVILLVGIGIILIQNGTTMSLIETIKSFSFWIVIPIMLIIVGIIQIVKCLSNKKKK